MGLGGIEPPTSALSVLDKVPLIRPIPPFNCGFVPGHATPTPPVPFRLGTFGARTTKIAQ